MQHATSSALCVEAELLELTMLTALLTMPTGAVVAFFSGLLKKLFLADCPVNENTAIRSKYLTP